MSDSTRRTGGTIGHLLVSPLCLGGNVFGWTADLEESFEVLDAYVGAGGNFLDTADGYSAWVEGNVGGESETIIGDWLAARGRRDEVVLATKIGAHPRHKGLAPETIRGAVEDSLRRLRTDHIDLLYTHFDDETVPVAEIIDTLDALVQAGTVREIGASNISSERLADSLAHSAAHDTARYVALQPHYNLVSRDTFEGPLAEVARTHSLAVVPYYALAAGFLTGKYRPGRTVASARAGRVAELVDSERGQRVLSVLDEVAAAHAAEPASVALAWLAAQPGVVAPLASARTVDQLPSLLAVGELVLTESEVTRLTEASAG